MHLSTGVSPRTCFTRTATITTYWCMVLTCNVFVHKENELCFEISSLVVWGQSYNSGCTLEVMNFGFGYDSVCSSILGLNISTYKDKVHTPISFVQSQCDLWCAKCTKTNTHKFRSSMMFEWRSLNYTFSYDIILGHSDIRTHTQNLGSSVMLNEVVCTLY